MRDLEKALFWDFDGTLVYPNAIWSNALYIVSANIGYEKPREEIFKHALSVAKFPNTCYMIGDNPIADIRGGKSVGMKSILVHREGVFDADYHCENLSEISVLLTT